MKHRYLWPNFYRKRLKILFPRSIEAETTSKFLNFGLKKLEKFFKSSEPWLLKRKDNLGKIPNKIPEEGMLPEKIISMVIEEFFPGVPNWRSPKLQYNICAPVNTVAQTLLSLGQEINIHNISTDFAGNCLYAEKIISKMTADLIDLPQDKVRALFSFGGTASNMYAMKLSINKAVPNAGKTGVPSNLYVMITEKAHFSHKTVGDWLGIGVDRLIQVNSDEESRSIIDDAEAKARSIIEKGGIPIIAGHMGKKLSTSLLAPFFGWPIPILLALQILFMNIVTDDLPAITLGLNKSSDDIMDEKPRKKAGILNKDLFIFLIISGTIMAIFSLLSFYFSFNILGQEGSYARTTALLTLIVLEIAGAFNFRSFRKFTTVW